MTKIGFLLAAMLAVGGCSKSSNGDNNGGTTPPAGGSGGIGDVPSEPAYQGSPECTGAIGKAMDVSTAARKAQLEARASQGNVTPEQKERFQKGIERGEKMMGHMKNVMLKRCTEDKWPSTALDCMSAVQKREDMRACIENLPGDMKTKAESELGGMRRPGMPPGGMPGSGFSPMNHPSVPGMGGSGAIPAVGSAAPAAGSAAAGSGAGSAAVKSTTASKTGTGSGTGSAK